MNNFDNLIAVLKRTFHSNEFNEVKDQWSMAKKRLSVWSNELFISSLNQNESIFVNWVETTIIKDSRANKYGIKKMKLPLFGHGPCINFNHINAVQKQNAHWIEHKHKSKRRFDWYGHHTEGKLKFRKNLVT